MTKPAALEYVEAPDGFPGELVICGQTWTVKYATNVNEQRGWLGVTESKAREITIDTDQSRESMVDTLLHEVLHACFATVACDLDEEANERICGTLAPLLISVLRSTPPWW